MIVATLRAQAPRRRGQGRLQQGESAALEKGIANLERHVNNVRNHYGLPCVVSINRFNFDTAAEIELLKKRWRTTKHLHPRHPPGGRRKGGRGGRARRGGAIEKVPSDFSYRPYTLPLRDKIKAIATKIYGARDVTADAKIRGQIKKPQEDGYGSYPVCVAKTQHSFSTDAQLRGAPSGHMINIREAAAAGAEFIVMVCGDVMTMPGSPKVPSAEKIDLDEDGKVVGLF